ncbi:uncharacterized protein JCM6883_007169 [Sporobolomyces salmoneus]|uniref:uncharacterized protein n=1 Tax=Sporobolomyces salmoneus TaxID=183962 RepID=UPI00316E045F
MALQRMNLVNNRPLRKKRSIYERSASKSISNSHNAGGGGAMRRGLMTSRNSISFVGANSTSKASKSSMNDLSKPDDKMDVDPRRSIGGGRSFLASMKFKKLKRSSNFNSASTSSENPFLATLTRRNYEDSRLAPIDLSRASLHPTLPSLGDVLYATLPNLFPSADSSISSTVDSSPSLVASSPPIASSSRLHKSVPSTLSSSPNLPSTRSRTALPAVSSSSTLAQPLSRSSARSRISRPSTLASAPIVPEPEEAYLAVEGMAKEDAVEFITSRIKSMRLFPDMNDLLDEEGKVLDGLGKRFCNLTVAAASTQLAVEDAKRFLESSGFHVDATRLDELMTSELERPVSFGVRRITGRPTNDSHGPLVEAMSHLTTSSEREPVEATRAPADQPQNRPSTSTSTLPSLPFIPASSAPPPQPHSQPHPASSSSRVPPSEPTSHSPTSAETPEADTTKRSTDAGGGRTRGWSPFAGKGEEDFIQLKGLLVSQLPRPKTKKEEEEQEREWSVPKQPISNEEVEETYGKMLESNTVKLLDHHHQLPSLAEFHVHFEHLPLWARQGGRPSFRSPIDERLNAEEVDKVFRFIYAWWFVLPLAEAEEFVGLLGAEKWTKQSGEYGCWSSFCTMKTSVEKAVKEAREKDLGTVDIFHYTGMGAGSELQKNQDCHGNRGTKKQRDASFKPSSRIFPSINSHFSRRIFMHAEVIFAIALESAPSRGGANVLSCGQVDVDSAFASFLNTFDEADKVIDLLDKTPHSLACILHDRALGLGAETIGELIEGLREKKEISRSELGEAEVEEWDSGEGSNKEEARDRWKRVREEEKVLRKGEENRFGEHKLPSDSDSDSNFVRLRLSSLVRQDPAAAGPSQRRSTKSHLLDKYRQEHKIDSRDWNSLQKLARSKLPYSNLDSILARLDSSSLPLQQEVVLYLLYRQQKPGPGAERTFDNLVSRDGLSKAQGELIIGNTIIYNSHGYPANVLVIYGIGIHATTREVVDFELRSNVPEPMDGAKLRLRWASGEGKLCLMEAEGMTAVENARGPVEWSETQLKKNKQIEGMAQILGL